MPGRRPSSRAPGEQVATGDSGFTSATSTCPSRASFSSMSKPVCSVSPVCSCTRSVGPGTARRTPSRRRRRKNSLPAPEKTASLASLSRATKSTSSASTATARTTRHGAQDRSALLDRHLCAMVCAHLAQAQRPMLTPRDTSAPWLSLSMRSPGPGPSAPSSTREIVRRRHRAGCSRKVQDRRIRAATCRGQRPWPGARRIDLEARWQRRLVCDGSCPVESGSRSANVTARHPDNSACPAGAGGGCSPREEPRRTGRGMLAGPRGGDAP